MVKVFVEAFEAIVRLPVSAPAAFGANTTLKVTLWEIASVRGSVIPFSLNPVPLALAEEIVTADFPVFVSVSARVLEPPALTVPKLTLVRLAARTPAVVPPPLPVVLPLPPAEDPPVTFAVTPPPFSCTLTFASEALLANATVPQNHWAA